MEEKIVKIKLWEQIVGYLKWDSRNKRSQFKFDKDFPKLGLDISPIAYSIHSKGAMIGIPGNKEKIYQGLPCFVADSLPDAWGNQVFKKWIALNNISSKKITPLDRLCFVGKRGMGALEYEPAHVSADESTKVYAEELYKISMQILKDRSDTILSNENILIEDLCRVGTSAGGRRAKAIIAINNKTGEIRSGQASLPQDYTYHIIKFNEGDDFPSTLVEMAYYRMATSAGIKMMNSKLIEVEGRKHFLTERFDRLNGEKLHVQTLAGISELADSYDDMFTIARRLHLSQAEKEQIFRLMVFNVLARNVDDHTKNFSFIMDRKGKWSLAPAYDLTFAVDLSAPRYANRQSLNILGKNDNVTEADFLKIAETENIKSADKIIANIRYSISNFGTFAKEEGISDKWIRKIDEALSLP